MFDFSSVGSRPPVYYINVHIKTTHNFVEVYWMDTYETHSAPKKLFCQQKDKPNTIVLVQYL